MGTSDSGTSERREAISKDGSPQARRVAEEMERRLGSELAPGLHIVATPIGNLGDISLRALATLARSDVIYAEDTRHSRPLLAHFAIDRPLRAYHDHSREEDRARVLEELAAGRRVALISDAGTPLVSDPGFRLVRAALDAGHAVTAVPGASAALAALAVAGLPTDTFLFAGFLPPRSAARRTRIGELKGVPATLVFFEGPSRAAETLADLAAVLGDRPGALARELTKLHEEVRRGPLATLAAEAAQRDVRGEVVILVGPPNTAEPTDDEITDKLKSALDSQTVRDAAASIAEALGVPRKRVYDLALALKRDGA